jgi:hypothetical protein
MSWVGSVLNNAITTGGSVLNNALGSFNTAVQTGVGAATGVTTGQMPGTGTVQQPTKSNTWLYWLIGIVVLIAIVLLIVKLKK